MSKSVLDFIRFYLTLNFSIGIQNAERCHFASILWSFDLGRGLGFFHPGYFAQEFSLHPSANASWKNQISWFPSLEAINILSRDIACFTISSHSLHNTVKNLSFDELNGDALITLNLFISFTIVHNAFSCLPSRRMMFI